jgi:hypothetical protein
LLSETSRIVEGSPVESPLSSVLWEMICSMLVGRCVWLLECCGCVFN